jgi:hypothetical protein
MQSGRKTPSLVGVALLATLASACLDSPRNGQILASKATVVDFEGWYPASNVDIKLWIWNNTAATWTPLEHPPIRTGTSGVTDNAGDTWYAYGTDLVLPPDLQYWRQGTSSSVVAKVKATAPGPYDLTTYDGVSWVDDCIEQWKPVGGAAIIQHCKSVASPAANLRVHCGSPSDTCCMESPGCAFGKNCSSAGPSGACTVTCGGLNQTCCQASPQCSADMVCKNNSCVDCGTAGDACCPGNWCGPDSVCQSGTCADCGSTGEICCESNACSSGNVCQSGACVLCSGLNQPCCPGDTCSSGLTCTAGICKAATSTCGQAYGACCPDGTCPGQTSAQPLRCNAVDKCVPCGHEHQDCCYLDVNPPFGCDPNLSCMSQPGGYKCECDSEIFPNGCG